MRQVIKIYDDIFTAMSSLRYRIVYRKGYLRVIEDELAETIKGLLYRHTTYEDADVVFGSYHRYDEAARCIRALQAVPKTVRAYVDKKNRKNSMYKIKEKIDTIDACKERNMFCRLKDGSILPYIILREDGKLYILKPDNSEILSEFKSRKEAKS